MGLEIFIELIWPVVEERRRALKFRVGTHDAGELISKKVCDSRKEVLEEVDRLIVNLVKDEIESFPDSFSVSERERLLA